MIILARRLIPQYKPNYVVVQYSEWLVDRSQSPFAPFYYGKLPTPFFTNSSEDKIVLHPPVFETQVFDVPVSEYRVTPKSIGDYLSFLIRVGFPLFMHDDLNMTIYLVKRLTGLVPSPIKEREKIVGVVYEEFGKLCQENQARMIVVLLGARPTQTELEKLRGIENAVVVDAESALYERLTDKSPEAYLMTYGHWRGPTLVDKHPNATAHEIIAREIVKAIKQSQ